MNARFPSESKRSREGIADGRRRSDPIPSVGQSWSLGGDTVVGRERRGMPAELPALVSVDDSGERVGIATYTVDGDTAELVTIDALTPGAGVGRRVLDARGHAAHAADAGCA